MDALRKALFNAMRNEIAVMAEHGDNEDSLMYELMTADDEILQAYKEEFLD